MTIHSHLALLALLVSSLVGALACSEDATPPDNSVFAGGSAPGDGDGVGLGNGDMNVGDGDMALSGDGDMALPGDGDMALPGDGDMALPGDGDMAVGDGDMAVGDGDMAVGDGDMAVGDGDMAVGDGDMAVGDGDMPTGDGDGSTGLGGPLMYTGPFTATPGTIIDSKYKCPMPFGGGTGENISPPLAWTGGPAETQSFAVVLYDTGYDMLHWVIWDIPASTTELPEGLASGFELAAPAGAHQAAAMGTDDHAYAGPCSAGAIAARAEYEFRLYAVDTADLGLTETASAAEAQAAVEAAMLESVVWVGNTE